MVASVTCFIVAASVSCNVAQLSLLREVYQLEGGASLHSEFFCDRQYRFVILRL